MSGIATSTRRYVDAIAGTGVAVLDTRKTTPGLRRLEKEAVRIGGGVNHRIGLFDQILLKENHFALADKPYREVVEDAVVAARQLGTPVVAEATDLLEAVAAVEGGADVILLDNFPVPDELTEGVEVVRAAASDRGRRVEIEASGGITLESIRAVAECGVDRISVGALTHSVAALDISMLLETTDRGGAA